MENIETGKIIRKLRLEHCMTQKQLADKLAVSDKAVSKWERGMGAPDISLVIELSEILNVNVSNLLSGDLSPNDLVGGNMKNSKYYICPTCQSVTVCTGNSEVSCCGKAIKALTASKPESEHILTIEDIEDDWYITSGHPMTKEHFISFVAFATADRIQIIQQYPEWNFELRIQRSGHGTLFWNCTKHGLYYQMM